MGDRLEIVEVWTATNKLRYLCKDDNIFSCDGNLTMRYGLLQQLYKSNIGNEEWRDVEVVTEK